MTFAQAALTLLGKYLGLISLPLFPHSRERGAFSSFGCLGNKRSRSLMGLSNFFPSVAEGVLPVLVMNTILSVALLKDMVKSALQVVGATGNPENAEEADDPENIARDQRRVSTARFESLCHNCSIAGVGASIGSRVSMECCVCLCRFEADEEVSELSCKHFFHKDCLEKWFENRHINTCPLCRSLD